MKVAVTQIVTATACRKSSFRQAGRLPRNVQDDLFFVPKAYKGTPSGQKKVKTILKSHKVRHFVRFSVKIKLDNYLFFIVVKSVLLLLCVYRQSVAVTICVTATNSLLLQRLKSFAKKLKIAVKNLMKTAKGLSDQDVSSGSSPLSTTTCPSTKSKY